ncbi:MAG TPA: GDSL-type esterase/lipase family protein [Xanthobacteraceae bacterium]|nr:GDSL-type esterase/lipase family protein [Xanthobacteraceae bacterium]
MCLTVRALSRALPITAAITAALTAVLALAAPAAAATLNIVAIGASNTTGFGVGSDHAYPALLQELLRKKGIHANVTNAGVNGDVTGGMLRRLDSAVPQGTDIVILQPGGNDLRFFGTKAARTANINAMAARLHARHIRVIVYDPDPVPPDFYQWDHIHFNAAAHAKIAATLAAQIVAQVAAKAVARPVAPAQFQPAANAPQAAPPKP